MKLLKFVNKAKKSSYFMLEADVNGKSVHILVNFPKGKNTALIHFISETRYVEADTSEKA